MIGHNLTKIWKRHAGLPFRCSCGYLGRRFLANDSTVQYVQWSKSVRSITCHSLTCCSMALIIQEQGIQEVHSQVPALATQIIPWHKDPGPGLIQVLIGKAVSHRTFRGFQGCVHPFIMHAHCQFSKASGTGWHFKAADGEVELRLQGVQNQINLRIIAIFDYRRVRIIHETNRRPNILGHRCRQRHEFRSPRQWARSYCSATFPRHDAVQCLALDIYLTCFKNSSL